MTDADADKLDAFLGDGTYDKWSELDGDALDQLARAKKLDAKLWHYDHSLAVLSPYGTDWVEKVHNDFSWGFDNIIAGKFPDPAQFTPLFEIYPLAIDTAVLQMDEADAIAISGLLTTVAGLRPVGFQIQARQLEQDLRDLEDLLQEAEAEEVEAEIKSALGFAIGTIELMLPGIGLLATAGLTLAEVALDDDNDPALATKGAKLGLEAIEDIEKAGKTVKHFAKRGAKGFVVIGFYFDAEEILHAGKHVKKIKAAMEEARQTYAKLSDTLSKAIRSFNVFKYHLDEVLRPVRTQIDDKRRERDAKIQQYSYSLIQPVNWRIIEDYTRFKTARP